MGYTYPQGIVTVIDRCRHADAWSGFQAEAVNIANLRDGPLGYAVRWDKAAGADDFATIIATIAPAVNLGDLDPSGVFEVLLRLPSIADVANVELFLGAGSAAGAWRLGGPASLVAGWQVARFGVTSHYSTQIGAWDPDAISLVGVGVGLNNPGDALAGIAIGGIRYVGVPLSRAVI